MINIDRYPNLALICWNRAERMIEEAEALAIYERNWRFVDENAMPTRERKLVAQLIKRHGNGVLLV